MSTLLFDFDGTLADTFYIAVALFRELARSWHKTDDKEIERLRGLPANEVLRALGVRWWQVPYIAYAARKKIHDKRDEVKVFTGMEPVLQQLHAEGHKLFIVSSNSAKNVDHFLHNNKLEAYFDGFYAGIGAFDKARALTKFVKSHQLDVKDCYYIGDEVRDIDAARKAGMQCVSVTWGYNNLKALRAARAKIVVERPKELLRLFSKAR